MSNPEDSLCYPSVGSTNLDLIFMAAHTAIVWVARRRGQAPSSQVCPGLFFRALPEISHAWSDEGSLSNLSFRGDLWLSYVASEPDLRMQHPNGIGMLSMFCPGRSFRQTPSSSRTQPRSHALIIGINYDSEVFPVDRGIRKLSGCRTDAEKVRKLLLDTYGWKPEEIRMMLDLRENRCKSSFPTANNLRMAFAECTREMVAGDVLVLYCHSVQKKSLEKSNGAQEEEDGLDEYIVPADLEDICDNVRTASVLLFGPLVMLYLQELREKLVLPMLSCPGTRLTAFYRGTLRASHMASALGSSFVMLLQISLSACLDGQFAQEKNGSGVMTNFVSSSGGIAPRSRQKISEEDRALAESCAKYGFRGSGQQSQYAMVTSQGALVADGAIGGSLLSGTTVWPFFGQNPGSIAIHQKATRTGSPSPSDSRTKPTGHFSLLGSVHTIYGVICVGGDGDLFRTPGGKRTPTGFQHCDDRREIGPVIRRLLVQAIDHDTLNVYAFAVVNIARTICEERHSGRVTSTVLGVLFVHVARHVHSVVSRSSEPLDGLSVGKEKEGKAAPEQRHIFLD
ncbi:hypothetical protein K488DRAFT_72089 [Vararia minispora EC-137]|uniref:Uncharacterized protein n=1 Tax=Vararia minispora EC-137 TaxID=1314806 RepID=A0ACB8QFY6_9AGAM|nr:hypothetical protein K488DRAFT_72089 [Vararia minispora EC-137]